MTGRDGTRALVLALSVLLSACPGAYAQTNEDMDPHVIQRPRDLKDDREQISAPILLKPIYACGTSVRVSGFLPHAKLMVFDQANPTVAIGSGEGIVQHPWQPVDVPALSAGQMLFVIQTAPDGTKSGPSNVVTVTSHKEDYPNGLPQPVLQVPPPLACGAAIGIEPPIPSATVRIRAEEPNGPTTFGPFFEIGNVRDFPYAFVQAFKEKQRITAQAEICSDLSPLSPPQIVAPAPVSLPKPGILPFVNDQDRLVITGEPVPSPAPPPLQGATLSVSDLTRPPGSQFVGGQPAPGTGYQQVMINPHASSSGQYQPTQALCTAVGVGDPVKPMPCEQMGAPKIRTPVPGDDKVEVTESQPGAEITVYINGVEQGQSGAPVIDLYGTTTVQDGDSIVVVQQTSETCKGQLAYQIDIACGRGGAPRACAGDWPAYRQSPLRDGLQPVASPLTDPQQARHLKVIHMFPPEGERPLPAGFRAGPIVFGNRVFIGNGNGRLYALDASTLALLWQWPPDKDPPLTSAWQDPPSPGRCANPSSAGISSSATVADLDGRPAIIFGAPDRSFGSGLGSGRLFALSPSGSVIWKSPKEVAFLTGITPHNLDERHEQIGYSSPLVLRGAIYVGIADHCDNPIQQGRVVASSVFDGSILPGFDFRSVSTRGGGIWSALGGGLEGGIFATTGNVASANSSEPPDNHGLSLVRLDPNTGALAWKLQPVPFAEDGDPDWSAGPTLMASSCGNLVTSTMKDGWAYAVNASTPLGIRWQFPPSVFPPGLFFAGDPYAHGDTRYHRSGAAWKDVFLAMMGGQDVTANELAGYRRIHALDVCSADGNRARWIADIASTSPVVDSRQVTMSPPSVTGGVVYVGTDLGHLVVLADPAIWPSPGLRCVRDGLDLAQCQAQGLQLVPRPAVLADIAIGQGAIFAEPALAQGRVYVATTEGRVVMLGQSK